jgi:hypothetical protein
MKRLIFIIALLMVTMLVAGCARYQAIAEEEQLPPVGAEEDYDDVTTLPGGSIYLANIHYPNRENPFPQVPIHQEVRGGWFGRVDIGYRDYIETGAGETRNNIFYAWGQLGFLDGRLRLHVADIPPGFTLSQVLGGLPRGPLTTVLTIEIAPDVAPGQYNHEIALEVQGWSCGTVPCIIEVVD